MDNTTAVKEFNKCINALALELPHEVWVDVHYKWMELQSAIKTPPTAHTEELSTPPVREVKSAEEVLKWHGVPIPEYPDGRKSLFAAMEEYASQFTQPTVEKH